MNKNETPSTDSLTILEAHFRRVQDPQLLQAWEEFKREAEQNEIGAEVSTEMYQKLYDQVYGQAGV
jgi:hypothetical protein